jgi:hypothetical protein
MIKIPLKRLVYESEAIVIGRVHSIQCEWSLDKQLILTVVKVRVQETIRGDLMMPEIMLEVPGGRMGDLSLKVSDVPAFEEGEQVLIFLRSIKNFSDTKHSFTVAQNYLSSFEVFGKAQGKYSIDADGMAAKNGYETTAEDEDSEKSISLARLKAQIRTILQEAPPGKHRIR